MTGAASVADHLSGDGAGSTSLAADERGGTFSSDSERGKEGGASQGGESKGFPSRLRKRGCRGKGSDERRKQKRRAQRHSSDHKAATFAPEAKKDRSRVPEHYSWQQQLYAAQQDAWRARQETTAMVALVEQQNAAIAQMATAMEKLAASISRNTFVNMRQQKRPQVQQDRPQARGAMPQVPKTDFMQMEANLRAKLHECLAAREWQRTFKYCSPNGHGDKDYSSYFESDERDLEERPAIELLMKYNPGKSEHYELHKNNPPGEDQPCEYTRFVFSTKGRITSTYKFVVDPGQFWHTQLVHRND